MHAEWVLTNLCWFWMQVRDQIAWSFPSLIPGLLARPSTPFNAGSREWHPTRNFSQFYIVEPSSGWCERAQRTSCKRSWCRLKRNGWVPNRVLCSICFLRCSTRHILLAHMLTKCRISSRHPHHVWKAHTQRWSSACRLTLVTWWLWSNVYCNFSPISIKRLILPSHSRRSDAILFIQTCSMTRCVELPTSIWSSLMLWTRLGVREVRWRSSFSESNSVGLFLCLYYFPIFTVYLHLLTSGPTSLFSYSHQDPPSIYDCQTARSTFNLRLPNSKIHLQFTIAKQQDPPSIYDCQTARSTFNLRLPKNMQGTKFVCN